MSFDPATALINLGESVITRLFPDPTAQAEQRAKMAELAQKGELAELEAYVNLMLAQIEVNKEQAKSKSLFVAGARPFVIWLCACGIGFTSIVHPLLVWVWAFVGMDGNPPEPIDIGDMTPLLTGLLGLGAMRSFDKSKGTQTDAING